jgi:hypothetical protein
VTAKGEGAANAQLVVPTADGTNVLGTDGEPLVVTLDQDAIDGIAAAVANAIAGTTVSSESLVDARTVRYEAPIAADLTTIKAAADVANGVITIAAQPDYPRKLQVRIVDANSSISAGTLTLVGVGARGQALQQVIDLAGGTRTVTTDDAFATLTSGTVAGLAGAATGDTLGIGPATALGLPGPKLPVGGTFTVYKSNVDNANEAVGTVDATAGTIVPTTVPNGTRTYGFWYTVAYAHNHSLSAGA